MRTMSGEMVNKPAAFYTRSGCRLCGGLQLNTVLALRATPPANEFVKVDDPLQDLIPLYLARCQTCQHVQLPIVVNPERLFRNYVYVSGTSPLFIDHFRRYAESCCENLRVEDLVVDIGSNDGTLLKAFRERGMRVHGVDPAREIAAQATAAGLPTWAEFFTQDTSKRLQATYGKAALIVANNVFAHADNLAEIALGVRDLLDPDRGRFVFEVQYLIDLVEKSLFDMIYHEHLSYHSLTPLVSFFNRLEMSVVDVERIDTHGGSIRCTVVPGVKDDVSSRLSELLFLESQSLSESSFVDLHTKIEQAGAALRDCLASARIQDLKVAGYGAPAKMTTLCYQFGITKKDVAYVVDDSPWKQGLLCPGTRIPVVASDHLKVDSPGVVVIFAWNFAEAIAKKLRASGFTGQIVAPLPEFKELP